MLFRPWSMAVLALAAACGGGEGGGRAACGLAALAGPTALLTQFGVPNQTLSEPPRRLPERLVVRVVAGDAYPAVVGRTDSLLVVGVEGSLPAKAPARLRGAGGGPAGADPRRHALRGRSGGRRPAAGQCVGRRCHRAAHRHSGWTPPRWRTRSCPLLPGFPRPMSAPRIAVSGVVRAWDGAERTGAERGLSALGRERGRRAAAAQPADRRGHGGPRARWRRRPGAHGRRGHGSRLVRRRAVAAARTRRAGSATCSSSRCSPPLGSAACRSSASAAGFRLSMSPWAARSTRICPPSGPDQWTTTRRRHAPTEATRCGSCRAAGPPPRWGASVSR